MVMAVVGKDLQRVVPAIRKAVRKVLGILSGFDQQIHPDLAVKLVLHGNIQDLTSQLNDGKKLIQHLLRGVLYKNTRLGRVS